MGHSGKRVQRTLRNGASYLQAWSKSSNIMTFFDGFPRVMSFTILDYSCKSLYCFMFLRTDVCWHRTCSKVAI